jgi:hypothetical protein
MTSSSDQFVRLASSDMVRRALESNPGYQPVANDDRIDALLRRLAEAENESKKPSSS